MIGNDTTSPAPAALAERRWLAIVRLVGRVILAAVLLMAAVTKISDLDGFENHVLLHANLPAPLERPVIFLLPWLELTCGMCLLLGCAVREASLIVVLLMIGFLWQGVQNYGEKDCGCFLFPEWQTAEPPWWPLVRNGALLLVGVFTAVTSPRRSNRFTA
jgi:uncharacterized membrane protein YphA (DoxX/SURF4 family)